MSDSSTVSLLVDIRSNLNALDEATSSIQIFVQKTEEAQKKVKTFQELLKEKLGITSGAEMAADAVIRLKDVIGDALKRSGQLADELSAAQGKAGISAEAFQALGYQVKEAGGSSKELLDSLIALRRNLGQAAGDSSSGPGKALAEIHLSAQALKGLPLEQQLEKIAQGLARVDDENRRAALSSTLLGANSASLGGLLDELAQNGFGAVAAQAERATGVMSGEMAKAISEAEGRAEDAREKFAKLMAPFALGKAQQTAELAGAGTDIAEGLINHPMFSGLAMAGSGAAGLVVNQTLGAEKLDLSGAAKRFATEVSEIWSSPLGWTKTAAANLNESIRGAPIWGPIGLLVAGGLLAAVYAHMYLDAKQNERDMQKGNEDAQDKREQDLRKMLEGARSQEMVDRVGKEAARRTADLHRRGKEAAAQPEADEAEVTRLKTLEDLYANLVKMADAKGAGIVAQNKALDEQNAKAAEANKLAASQQAEIAAIGANQERIAREEAERAFQAADPARKIELLQVQEEQIKKHHDELRAVAKDEADRSKLEADGRNEVAKIEAQILALRKAGAEVKTGTETPVATTTAQEASKVPAAVTDTAKTGQAVMADDAATMAAEEAKAAAKRANDTADAMDALLAETADQEARLKANPFLAPGERKRALQQLRGYQNDALDDGIAALDRVDHPDAQMQKRRAGLDQHLKMNEFDRSTMSGGQTVLAGAADWSTKLGTQAEQVAGTLQSTLGQTVHSIGDGIYGWITKTESFGDAMRNLGSSVLKMVLQTIVQIGVQQLVNLAISKMVGEQQHSQAKADIGENATAGGLKSVAMLGPIWGPIAFAAALAGILALTHGFSSGGYTGDGGVHDPAGMVHRGEVVWSQADIARAGGVDAVEAMRLGGGVSLDTLAIPAAPAVARVAAPAPVAASLSGGLGGAVAGRGAKTQPMIAFAENLTDIKRIKRQPGWEDAIVETVQRRKGEIFS